MALKALTLLSCTEKSTKNVSSVNQTIAAPERGMITSFFHAKHQAMNSTSKHDERMAKMSFASVYPMYLARLEKKGRTEEELRQVITWLTGFNNEQLHALIDEKASFESFFQKATLNPHARLITGMICGYRVENIENPLTQKIRYLDKLVDELAKGRKMEKILRHP